MDAASELYPPARKMGNLLGSPITEKDTHVGVTHDSNPNAAESPDGGGMPYGVSSMQGWRIHMEDAHIAQPFMYAERRIKNNKGGAGGGAGGAGDAPTPPCGDASPRGKDEGSMTPLTPGRKTAVEATLSEEGTARVNITEKTPAKSATTMPPMYNTSNDGRYLQIPLPNHALFAVFDGHGGSFAAEYASRNLLRVLCRSEIFCDYAEKWRRREEYLSGLKGNNEKAEAGDQSKDKQQKDGSDDKEEKDFEFARATYDHELMTLLEHALRDAFIDLDAEILREVRGEEVEDANLTYGAGYDLSQHSLGEIVAHLPKEASGDAANGGDTTMGEAKEDKETNDSTKKETNQQSSPHPTPSDDEDAGTTAVCVLTTPKWIVCANAGDSRAVYSRSGHRAVPLSYDHKPDDEDEQRRVREAGGYVSGGRVEGDLAVSRGLGDFRFKEPDAVLSGSKGEKAPRNGVMRHRGYGEQAEEGAGEDAPMLRPSEQKVSPVPDIIVQNRDPKEDEFIIIACDGIWDVQTNQECVRMVADVFGEGETDPGLVCEEILDLCLIKGSKDNMTAAVVKLPKQPIGNGGGVLARRERRGASSAKGNGGDKDGEQNLQGRVYNPYVPPEKREGEGNGDDDDSDDDQWASSRG